MIKELVEKYPAMVEAKRKIDRVIDICGPSPKGTGLQNMREAIVVSDLGAWLFHPVPFHLHLH